MGQLLGVKFQSCGPVYYFDAGEHAVGEGDCVVVQTEQGAGLGRVVSVRDALPPGETLDEIKIITRPANPEDMAALRENEALAAEAAASCRNCIRERALEMKLVDVEVFFDRSKIVFYFSSPGRVDFRELVKDLVRTFRTRIELRQIGVRHETQMIGALSSCGMVCCCRRFLRKFAPVTIRMAKEQNLFLNPAKISGICGRLLCCLSYEQEHYEQFHQRCPKIAKRYMTTIGPVKVLRANLFRQSLSLLLDSGEEKEVSLEEWTAMSPRRPEETRQAGEQAGQPSPEEVGADAVVDDGGGEEGRSEERAGEKRPAAPAGEQSGAGATEPAPPRSAAGSGGDSGRPRRKRRPRRRSGRGGGAGLGKGGKEGAGGAE